MESENGKSTYNIVVSFFHLSHALSHSEILILFCQDVTLEPQAVFSVILAREQPSRTTWLLPCCLDSLRVPHKLSSLFRPPFAFYPHPPTVLSLTRPGPFCPPQIDDEQPRQQPVFAGEWPAAGPGGLAAAFAGESAAESSAYAPAPADHDPRARAALPAQERLHPADCQRCGHR